MLNTLHLQLPNALSIARLLGSPLLIWALPALSTPAMLILFGLLGLTDFLDGWLARRWKIASEAGALLDGLADLVFYPTAAWLLYSFHPQVILANAALIGFTFALLAITMAVSVLRCGKLVLLHTQLSRVAGVMAVLAVFATFAWSIPAWIAGVAILYNIAFLESIVIFWRYGAVSADTRSLRALQTPRA